MPIVHSDTYSFAFSLNKQNTMDVAVDNAQINKARSMRNFAPITKTPTRITDRNWYGKGHGWSTFADRVTELYTIPAQERSATSLEALYAAAFCMGNVASVASGTGSGEYIHTVTFQDPTVNTEVLYTTVGEAMGSEYKKILKGAWINSFTLTGNRNDHVVISFEGGGRSYDDGTYTVPTITPASFYKTVFGRAYFGAYPGALSDISVEVLSFNLTVTQNAQPMFLLGNSAGEEHRLSKCLIGKQGANASVTIMVNETHRDRFLNEEEVGLKLTLRGSDLTVAGGNNHTCNILLPRMMVATEGFGVEGSTVSYTLNFAEDAIIYDGGAQKPLTFEFWSNIDTSELLVASP